MSHAHRAVDQRRRRQVGFATTLLAGLVAQAWAQQSAVEGQAVTVTGYRSSLNTSATAKKNATGFADSVFAEDMGKFPDSNIAESLNRIPGIAISREITGEGLQIQIRGLGTNFTKILLNGAPVAVASTGRTDSQSTNREVDLDLLPTDLFTQLSVAKSPTAAMLEGGAAGVVDMRSARPFDNRGEHYILTLQAPKNSVADKIGNRGSFLASKTFGDSFGILGGVSWSSQKILVTGFETIGWTNANLSATQNTGTRNSTGGGNWTIPATVPANAGNGLTTGATIDQAFLLANNPGLSITQIDNAIIPRLGRPMDENGTKDRYSGLLSMEYRPANGLRFYVDAMGGHKKNDMMRTDMNWVGRNGAMIPLNMQVDRSDCSTGCVVTKGTFANAQFFLEQRPYIETADLWSVNPGMEWKIDDRLKLDAQANMTRSKFHRESPSFVIITPASSGLTVNYDNTGGGTPIITSNVDLNNPASFGWSGGRVNIQDERRTTETKGLRSNLTWGDKSWNIRTGVAYDDVSRRITALDNSQAWQNAVCGNNPSVFLASPNGQPACNGANAPGSAAALYPGYGTGYTAGATGGVTFQGSLVPSAALASFLTPGPFGYILVDWDKFAAAANYAGFHAAAPVASASNTGAGAGYVREKTTGLYIETNGDTALGGFGLRYNAGVRWVHTDQTVGGLISLADPRNATLTSGGLYPNAINDVNLSSKYDNVLPSLSAALNLTKDVVVRSSVSRTMTRADPNAMRPGINFSTPSADLGTVGNSALKPYKSDNLDLGIEWYTGKEGYMSLTAFTKKLTGFTAAQNITVPFSYMAQYGVTYGTLTPTQQAAINARGGPDVATVVLSTTANADGDLKIKGLELGWVQPLDQWLPIQGLGFSANYTKINQSVSGAGNTGVALGVPPSTYNLTAYYERGGVMVRLSQTFSKGSQVSTANQNGIPLAALFVDDYKQLDLSTSIDLDYLLDKKYAPTLTFDVTNLGNSKQRQYFQFSNATFTEYKPGRTYVLGLRAKF